MVGGVAVANGSTLSTTGEMQVTCNVPYVLTVDGVEWVPTASAGGVDSYLLSTGGVVRIFINGTRYFIFTNSIVQDFAIDRVVGFRAVGSDEYDRVIADSTYAQVAFSTTEGSPAGYVSGLNVTPQEIIDLGVTCNNGSVQALVPDWAPDQVFFSLSGYNFNQYGAVFAGNVLVAFFEPIS